MTSSNVTNLLIVATLPASWHDLCKNTSDPSGDSCKEGFPVIWLNDGFHAIYGSLSHLETWVGRKLCFHVRVLELKPVSAKYWLII
jgi:hypothetical protein